MNVAGKVLLVFLEAGLNKVLEYKLTVTPKGGVKMWHPICGGITVSCQWLLHDFTGIWHLQQYIYYVWMVLLLLQQVSPMDDAIW